MALIQYSALVNQMSGKLNGSVASFNRGGSYLRNKGIVTNPNSIKQANARANFANASSGWRGLEDQEQKSWKDFADQTPYTNVFGETKKLSGFAMYVQRNLNISLTNGTPLRLAPMDRVFPDITFDSFALDISTGNQIIVGITSPAVLGNWQPQIMATPILGNGIGYFKNLLRRISPTAVSGAVPTFNIASSAYVANFGTPILGDKLGISVYFVNSITGQSTVAVQSLVIAS